MKNLRISATITLVLGFFAILSMIFLFLALSDIAHNEPDLSLEWRIAGISMIVIGVFTISSFATIGILLKNWNQLFQK
jgi:hypothetical protein